MYPIASTLYFGIDAFYPGGWEGASQTAADVEARERGDKKFYKTYFILIYPLL